jgi:hypothetical protein
VVTRREHFDVPIPATHREVVIRPTKAYEAMSSHDAMDELSATSDDTRATSNVAMDQERSYNVPMDEGGLMPYGSGAEHQDDDWSQPDHGAHVSRPRNEDQDEEMMLNAILHNRRRSHFSDYDDDGDDVDMAESFAYGDLSGPLGTFEAPYESALVPVPESQELVTLPQSRDLVRSSQNSAYESHERALVRRSRSASSGLESCDDDQPSELALVPPVPAGGVTNSLVVRQSRAIDAPRVAETALARPQQTALVPAGSENKLVSKQRSPSSGDSIVSRTSKNTAISDWDGYDERTLTSTGHTVDDEKSLTPTEIFEDRSVPRQKAVPQPAKIWEKDDDESTINTYGDSYWTSQHPVEKHGYPVKPETIDEGDEESSSQGSGFKKPDNSGAASFRSRESFSSILPTPR